MMKSIFLLSGILGLTLGLKPRGGSLFCTAVVSIWMWCVAFTMDLVCLMEQVSKVLSSGLSFFNGSISDREVVDVAVLRKVTLFKLFNFWDNSSPDINTSDVVDSWLLVLETGWLWKIWCVPVFLSIYFPCQSLAIVWFLSLLSEWFFFI